MAISEALKRVRSHSNVIGVGVISSRGALVESSGEFDESCARSCARLIAVATRALEDGECAENDHDTEIVRAQRGDREIVVARCGAVALAVATHRRPTPPARAALCDAQES